MNTTSFAIGYILGVITGPMAIFAIGFHFTSRDRRATVRKSATRPAADNEAPPPSPS